MDATLSKAESLTRVKVLQAVESDVPLSPERDHRIPTGIEPVSGQSSSLDGIAIARAELSRSRRKLGTLTPGQEVAIEDLLLSTATRISELVGTALELQPHSVSSCTLLQEPSSHSSN